MLKEPRQVRPSEGPLQINYAGAHSWNYTTKVTEVMEERENDSKESKKRDFRSVALQRAGCRIDVLEERDDFSDSDIG